MPRVVDAQELDGRGVQRSPENCTWQHTGLHGSPGDATDRPETHGFAALLTMRSLADLILRSRVPASRRIKPPLSVALEIQPFQHGVRQPLAALAGKGKRLHHHRADLPLD